jgi:RimJ/RimL family protein N-acetyltransferase
VFKRLGRLFRELGPFGLVKRIFVLVGRNLFRSRLYVYGLDLPSLDVDQLDVPPGYSVEKIGGRSEINEELWAALSGYRDPALWERQMKARFPGGAALWVGRIDGKPAGFTWIVQGKMLESFFFPLLPQDVYSFDGAVLPEFRGHAFFGAMRKMVIRELRRKGIQRWYLAVHQWNIPMRRAVDKAPFKLLGVGRKLRVLNRTLVLWFSLLHEK